MPYRVHSAGEPDMEDGAAVYLGPEDGNTATW